MPALRQNYGSQATLNVSAVAGNTSPQVTIGNVLLEDPKPLPWDVLLSADSPSTTPDPDATLTFGLEVGGNEIQATPYVVNQIVKQRIALREVVPCHGSFVRVWAQLLSTGIAASVTVGCMIAPSAGTNYIGGIGIDGPRTIAGGAFDFFTRPPYARQVRVVRNVVATNFMVRDSMGNVLALVAANAVMPFTPVADFFVGASALGASITVNNLAAGATDFTLHWLLEAP